MQVFKHIRLIDPTTGSAKPLELPVHAGNFPNAEGGLRTVRSHDEVAELGEQAAEELLKGFPRT